MKHIATLIIALPPLAFAPACDSPEDEAELTALDIEGGNDQVAPANNEDPEAKQVEECGGRR